MRQNHTTLPIFSGRVTGHLYNHSWEYHSVAGDSLVAFRRRQRERIDHQKTLGQRLIKC